MSDETVNVILQSDNSPDGAALTRLKERKHVVIGERDDASEAMNWAMQRFEGVTFFSIPGDRWDQIFGGQHGR